MVGIILKYKQNDDRKQRFQAVMANTYTQLYDQIKNFDCAQRFAHLSCHTNLRIKVVTYAERSAETEGDK